MEEIYVSLLDEGTELYRPVPATKLGPLVYQIDKTRFHDTTDETWEFHPGNTMVVEKRVLSDGQKLVALSLRP